MKYVFFGTPRFAEIVLDRLIKADAAPVALVSNPDRPVGRKKIVTAPLTKQRALKSDATFIDIMQPETLDETFIKRLKALEPDFFVVAAYAKIIPQEILDIPRLGTLGVHPSLLPEYRGASPIQSVILAGEKTSGTTIYLMDAKMDHGPILATKEYTLAENENYLSLEKKLAELGADLLLTTMPELLEMKAKPRLQDESKATYTKKFKTDDAYLDEEKMKPEEMLRKVNAFNPEPGAWMMKDGKRTKILAAKIVDGRLVPTETRG